MVCVHSVDVLPGNSGGDDVLSSIEALTHLALPHLVMAEHVVLLGSWAPGE